MSASSLSLLLLLLLSSCLSLSTATSSPATVTFGRSRPAAAHNWQPLHRAPSSDTHSFVWLFPTRNSDWLQTEVAALSDPSSTRYLQHHSYEAIQAQIGPTTDDKERVKQWLTGGMDGAEVQLDDYGHAVHVTTTVAVAEQMFNTTLHHFVHQSSQRTATLAIDSVSVPVALVAHLDRLDGLYNFPMPVATKARTFHATAASTPPSTSHSPHSHSMHTMQTQETNVQCAANRGGLNVPTLSPASLAAAYNYTERNDTTIRVRTSSAVVGGFSVLSVNNQRYNEAFSPVDLQHFQTAAGFASPFTATTYNSNNAVNLANNIGILGYNATNEASLDIQALFQVNPTGTNGFYAVTGQSTSLLTSLLAIAALGSAVRPQVVSYSYSFGYTEWDYWQGDQGATETALQQLAALGVTVVISSGDDGAQGMYNRQCNTAATLHAVSPSGVEYAPLAFSSSPLLPTSANTHIHTAHMDCLPIAHGYHNSAIHPSIRTVTHLTLSALPSLLSPFLPHQLSGQQRVRVECW